MNLHQLLVALVEKNATELYVTTGSPPQLRLEGELVPLKTPPLTPVESAQLISSVLTEVQRDRAERSPLLMSFGIKGLSRFRAAVYMQRGALAAEFRPVPFGAPQMTVPGLDAIRDWPDAMECLLLFAGPRRSGRTTNVARVFNAINEKRHWKMLAVEHPIEFLHPHKNSLVDQLEQGADFLTEPEALELAMRSTSDVIFWGLAGEWRRALSELTHRGGVVMACVDASNPTQARTVLGDLKTLSNADVRMVFHTLAHVGGVTKVELTPISE